MEGLENDKSKIERLKDALYSRKTKMKTSFVLDLHGHKTSVDDKWQKDEEPKGLPPLPGSLAKKIFFGALGFFAVSIIIAAYIYISGSNLISSSKIVIDIIGPPRIVAGEVSSFDVAITNRNDITLEIADLLLSYPAGTRDAKDSVTPISHDRVAFGDIAPGQTVRRTVKSVLFGEEGESVHVDMSLEYRLANTTSVFTKDTAYDGLVGSSPLALSVEALKEVNANQEYTLKVKVVSNSSGVMKNVILTGRFPSGFEQVSYSQSPAKGTMWSLGDIEPHGERSLTIKGKMYGDKDENRFFYFELGVADEKDKNKIGASIASVTQTVAIKKPFLGVAIRFGKQDEESFVAKGGGEVDTQLLWTNNLDVPLYDISITGRLSGNGINPLTITPTKGFYDSNTGIISWSSNEDKALAKILPGASGSTELAFDTLAPASLGGAKITNPSGTLDITIKAKRLLESGVPQEIISTAVKTFKVATDAQFSSQITHTTGAIENVGDIPPKVGEETTYTITWAVTNTFNPLSGAKVSATLPAYVEWKNIVVPSSENIAFNTDSRTIVWNLGDVAAQKGGIPTLRKVSFQVGFIPSTSQIGKVPNLENIANFEAFDTFTGKSIAGADQGLSTTLKTDPAFDFGDDAVIP